MAPLIAPDYWMNSQLSIARFYGAIQIEGQLYLLDKPSGFLVRRDLVKHVSDLGFETVKKALKRYGDCPKTRNILKRLTRIIKARKRAEKAQELELF